MSAGQFIVMVVMPIVVVEVVMLQGLRSAHGRDFARAYARTLRLSFYAIFAAMGLVYLRPSSIPSIFWISVAITGSAGFAFISFRRRRRGATSFMVPFRDENKSRRLWISCLAAAALLIVSITLEIIAAPIDLDAIFTALASLLLLCGTLMSLNARSGVTEWGVLQLGSSIAWSDIESYRWEHFERASLLRLERVDAAWLRKEVQVLVQPDYVARIDHVLADRLHQPASRSGR